MIVQVMLLLLLLHGTTGRPNRLLLAMRLIVRRGLLAAVKPGRDDCVNRRPRAIVKDLHRANSSPLEQLLRRATSSEATRCYCSHRRRRERQSGCTISIRRCCCRVNHGEIVGHVQRTCSVVVRVALSLTEELVLLLRLLKLLLLRLLLNQLPLLKLLLLKQLLLRLRLLHPRSVLTE